jgi:hypothetical protein
MMRSDRLPQFWADNHARALGCRTTSEEHDTAACVLEGSLQEANGNAKSNAGTANISAIAGDGPRVFLKLLEGFCELEFGLLHREQESSGWPHGHRTTRLLWHAGSEYWLYEAKHLLDLLGGIFLATAEDVGFGAFGIADLMNLGLGSSAPNALSERRPRESLTIVPYVIRPTRAVSGRRLKLITKDSFNAFRLSSSWHVSTT